jgi:hypothetical protein
MVNVYVNLNSLDNSVIYTFALMIVLKMESVIWECVNVMMVLLESIAQ